MHCSTFGMVLGTVLLASGTANAAITQTPGSRVLITKCDPRAYNNATNETFRATPYKTGLRTTLTVDYQNDAPNAATAVVFGLVSNGKLVGVGQDNGTFSPEAAISHELILNQELAPDTQPQCVVLRVKYANGTAWFNPSAPSF